MSDCQTVRHLGEQHLFASGLLGRAKARATDSATNGPAPRRTQAELSSQGNLIFTRYRFLALRSRGIFRTRALAICVLAFAAACSSTKAAAPVASPTGRASALRAFAQCMQQHGVAIPTPSATPGAGGRGLGRLFSGINRNDPKVISAFQACRAQIGPGFGGGRRFPGPSPSPSKGTAV
jgi:hypothetical protein